MMKTPHSILLNIDSNNAPYLQSIKAVKELANISLTDAKLIVDCIIQGADAIKASKAENKI